MDQEQEHKSSVLLILLLAVLYAVSWVFMYQKFFIPGFTETQKNRVMVSRLQQEIRKLEKENEQLKAMVEALRANDPAAWEDATRKYLGWVKPGEVIIETEE